MESNKEDRPEVSYFGPGPAKISKEVLLQLQSELVYFKDTNISILELSHRSEDFICILKEAEYLVRTLLDVPDNYHVIFTQGGGNGQFAAVPLNLMSKTGKADYLVSGTWSAKAVKEAMNFGNVNLVLPITRDYISIPDKKLHKYTREASYVYYCDNETVDGIEFPFIPESPFDIPLVCDMSSNIFTREFDVKKFGVIFGGAQKNIGTAGVTVVIIRGDLIGSEEKYCPSILNYAKMVKEKSLLNTPSVFSIHVLTTVLQNILKKGGVSAMEQNAKEKSSLLYECIDSSNGFYESNIEVSSRSRMNVVFRIGEKSVRKDLEKKFLEEATQSNLLSLKGHRSVGGIRASLYNAVTIKDVKRLVSFMLDFHKRNGPE